jgi:hypothetical protein
MPADAFCALCLSETGEKTPAVKGWDGAPICRVHVAECIAKANGIPVIAPTIDCELRSPSLH